MIRVKHLLSEPIKISELNTDVEFIKFANQIKEENEDYYISIETFSQAEDYINKFCDNLKILSDDEKMFTKKDMIEFAENVENRSNPEDASIRDFFESTYKF